MQLQFHSSHINLIACVAIVAIQCAILNSYLLMFSKSPNLDGDNPSTYLKYSCQFNSDAIYTKSTFQLLLLLLKLFWLSRMSKQVNQTYKAGFYKRLEGRRFDWQELRNKRVLIAGQHSEKHDKAVRIYFSKWFNWFILDLVNMVGLIIKTCSFV